MDTDHVIDATGYNVNIDRLVFSIRCQGPSMERQCCIRFPVVGAQPAFRRHLERVRFRSVMQFVHGSKHAAAFLAGHLRGGARKRSAQRYDDSEVPAPAWARSSAASIARRRST